MNNIKKQIFEMPFKDVYHDVPEAYVKYIIEKETERENKRVKSKMERLLLFLKLKKPWKKSHHVVCHSEEYLNDLKNTK